MTAIVAWIAANPQLVSLIVGGLISIICTILVAIFKPRTPEEYAAMTPRKAAILKLGAAVLPDVIKALKALQQLSSGKSDVELRQPKDQ